MTGDLNQHFRYLHDNNCYGPNVLTAYFNLNINDSVKQDRKSEILFAFVTLIDIKLQKEKQESCRKKDGKIKLFCCSSLNFCFSTFKDSREMFLFIRKSTECVKV